MLGSPFDLTKEVAKIASRRDRDSLPDPAVSANRDEALVDQAPPFGSPEELDRLLKHFIGDGPAIRFREPSCG